MAIYKRPKFLEGTFFWQILGYEFAEPPPINLLSQSALNSDDPWLTIAAVLEHAKHGDHSQISRLNKYLSLEWGENILSVAIRIIGDAGTEKDLYELVGLLENHSCFIKSNAAQAASMAGRLWLVPPMLEAWKKVDTQNEHNSIGRSISLLLESPGGVISAESGTYDLSQDLLGRLKQSEFSSVIESKFNLESNLLIKQPITQFERLVEARLNELIVQFGENQAIWQGKALSIRVLAEKMYSLVRDPTSGPLHGLFIPMRSKFESSTGLNCAQCYRNGVLQPLVAASLLEEFLESDQSRLYEEGIRYFFGHRIPD